MSNTLEQDIRAREEVMGADHAMDPPDNVLTHRRFNPTSGASRTARGGDSPGTRECGP
jgi:hypothetical protein